MILTVCEVEAQVSVRLLAETLTAGVLASGTTVTVVRAELQLFCGSVAVTVNMPEPLAMVVATV